MKTETMKGIIGGTIIAIVIVVALVNNGIIQLNPEYGMGDESGDADPEDQRGTYHVEAIFDPVLSGYIIEIFTQNDSGDVGEMHVITDGDCNLQNEYGSEILVTWYLDGAKAGYPFWVEVGSQQFVNLAGTTVALTIDPISNPA